VSPSVCCAEGHPIDPRLSLRPYDIKHQPVSTPSEALLTERMASGAVYSDSAPPSPPRSGPLPSRLVTCDVADLRPHPKFIQHNLAPSLEKLSRLATRGEDAFREPVSVTQDLFIIDGYARWQVARQQRRGLIECLQHHMTEEEALLYFIQRQRRTSGLNDFTRILLALELAPWFKTQALSNQKRGGQLKASSNLTEAERVNVRAKIAEAAGVSLGNVTKVKQLQRDAHPTLIKELRNGGLSIHKGWLWSTLSYERQFARLEQFHAAKGINTTIQRLIGRHSTREEGFLKALHHLRLGLAGLDNTHLSAVAKPLKDLLCEIDRLSQEND
jgi:hypothetical protein